MKRITAFLFAASLPVLAAPPVATLTGTGTSVNGRELQTSGAPNWPVAADDEIVAGPSGARLTLPDGSQLALAAGTRVVMKSCGTCVAQVFNGAVNYRKAADSTFEMCAIGRAVRPTPSSEGSVAVQGAENVVHRIGSVVAPLAGGDCACNAAAPWKTANHLSKGRVAAVTAVGAGATAGGIAVAKRNPKGGRGNDYNPPGQSKK